MSAKPEFYGPNKECDENGVCCILGKFIQTQQLKGLVLLQYSKMTTGEPTRWFAAYRKNARASESALVLNFCPWCGGTPGSINEESSKSKPEPTPTPDPGTPMSWSEEGA